ncbi:MAG: (Fe-S)-binding protein [Candidatus Heimdallarchaeaceae archaeon]
MAFPSSLLEYVQKCVYCGYCSVCPTYKELGWETNHPRSILDQIKSYLLEDLSRDAEKTLFDSVFSCTLCGACQNICIVDIPIIDIWILIRQESFNKGRWKQEMIQLTENVKATHNIFGLDPEDRLKWTEFSGINLNRRIQKNKPYVYFIGCQASYSGKMAKIAESVIKILRKARVDFTVLGSEEWCCGSPIFLGGGYELGKSIAEHNYKQIKKLSSKTLVVACAGCYRTFKNVYPEILGEKWDINVMHFSELLEELIKEGKIKFTKKIREKLTYKDPCELARHTGVTEIPRTVITKIPDVRYEELISNRDKALCCGGGGLLKVSNDELTEEVNNRLIEEIKYSEADIVVNNCPVCLDTIKQGVKRNNLEVEVIDLSELIVRAMGLEDEDEK